MVNCNNESSIQGILESSPNYSHTVMGEAFYSGTLLAKRFSGTVDRIPITIPGKLLEISNVQPGSMMIVNGQIRTYNKVIDGTGRLCVALFANDIFEAHGDNTQNKVSLTGTVCKAPVYRDTPFGREICDIMLAVNRAFGKSDYIPCIAWGRNARYAATLDVGTKLTIGGRLQSREYQKMLDTGEYITRIVNEVSIFKLDKSA